MATNPLSRLMRVASAVICLIVAASFVAFAVEESKGASVHQQAEIDPSAIASQATLTAEHTGKPAHGGLRRALDDASGRLTSPFSALTDRIESQWGLHAANLLLVLLVYGFGLAYLSRIVRFGE